MSALLFSGNHVRSVAALLILISLCLLPFRIARAGVDYRLVAFEGRPVAGGVSGEVYHAFSSRSVINMSGQVAFRGFGENLNTGDRFQGVWSEGGGALRMIAREGDQVPGLAQGIVFDWPTPPIDQLALNDAGDVSFRSMLEGPGVGFNNARGFWAEQDGVLQFKFRRWSDAPDLESFTGIRQFRRLAHSHAGQFAMAADFIGAASTSTWFRGIWMEVDGELQLIAREGGSAPDARHASELIDDFGHAVAYFNKSHQVVFVGDVVRDRGGNKGFSFPTHVIWAGGPESIREVARGSTATPGIVGGRFGEFTQYDINDNGRTIFSATLTNGVQRGVWVETPEGLRPIAFEEPLEGTSEDDLYPATSRFGNRFYLNNHDQVALHARVAGPGVTSSDRDGIWVDRNGDLGLVVRTSDEAAGAGPGIVFDEINELVSFNDVGQILFTALLRGSGIDEGNDFGLWTIDARGQMELILREGQLFNINPFTLETDLRIVKGFVPSEMNDSGQLALKILFEDGTSGVFVATVPEAGTVLVLGFGCAWGLRRQN